MKYLVIIFLILYIILFVWTFTDIIHRFLKKDKDFSPYWIFFIILLPLLGSILYFHFKHDKRMKKSIFFSKT